jgi:hypothetical protein
MQKVDLRQIVVGGYPGSGCLLLGRMLDAHPQVRCGPPTGWFIRDELVNLRELTKAYQFQAAWLPQMAERAENRAHLIELFAGMARARAGAKRWADCTPANVMHIETVFEWCPEAMFIHVVREAPGAIAAVCNSPGPDVRNEVEKWRAFTEAGQQWREHPRYAEINYPVLKDEQSMRNLFLWLELPWEPRVMDVPNETGNMFVVNMVRQMVEADESLSKLNAHL